MQFSELLSRADSSLLQDLLGVSATRLLEALSPDGASPKSLRGYLLELRTPSALLLDPAARRSLLELLRPDEARELVDALGARGGRDYEVLASLRVQRGSDRSAILHSFFGLAEPERATPPVPPLSNLSGGYELFTHQRRAVAQATEILSGRSRRLLVHMPTGSGKTRTAMSLAADHLRRTEPTVVLWLAATEELCEQAAEEFSKAWKLLGNRGLKVVRWWGANSSNVTVPEDAFVVAGLAKIYSQSINSPPWLATLGDRTSLVVFDEAHQAVAPTYRHVVDALLARRSDTGLLGLSATPGRTWNDVTADQELADYFARQKVKLEIPGYTNPVEYLIAEDYLARPQFRSLEVGGPDLTDDERQRIATQLDLPDSILKKLADDHLRNLLIANEARSLARRHKRFIVFAATVAHAELLATALRAIGVRTKSVTGSTPSDERDAAIRWYRQESDEPRILTNFGVLTTGFDAPRTSAAVIARPTKSLVLYSQMIGRAIRGPRAGGNKEAEIVTVVDGGLPGFRSVTEAFSNWEDVWRQ